jgi:hypothetical protein
MRLARDSLVVLRGCGEPTRGPPGGVEEGVASCLAEWQYTETMAVRKRDRGLAVRMLDSELTMLAALADHEGVSSSEWIRNIIRREHAIVFSAKQPKRKK